MATEQQNLLPADLTGTCALVTGAAKGIGRATATAFARAGAVVLLLDVDEAGGGAAAEEIVRAGGTAMFQRADVADAEQVDGAVSAFEAVHGGVDVLVNNAALVNPGTVDTMSEASWAAVIGVNLTGTFLVSRRVLPSMQARGRGVILNLASITGLVGRAGRPAYCASKGGIIALSRAMAVDHGPAGVRVNAVCPSGVETDQMAELYQESPDPEAARAEAVALHPVGRLAAPEELAAFLTFLASDRASFITGSVLTFDGGYTAV
ncbi:SDR family NAD(P)-dependent oxidoreductase [Cellulosimicrobium cellulans]|uniref:SDR family NAD(P)-dependent oxidoreductase n=1 Tax=Cellulosimicrobium cellulans TaxID=1710 RepID=UPI00130DDC9B|nr:SDR family NAD(P)-dependent oxidoreductase [Cellulosimicrobium cellulans]